MTSYSFHSDSLYPITYISKHNGNFRFVLHPFTKQIHLSAIFVFLMPMACSDVHKNLNICYIKTITAKYNPIS